MSSAFTNVYSVILDCRSPGSRDECSIPLPRQSRGETSEDQWRLRVGTWPTTFLCLRHRRAFVRSELHVHPVAEIRPPGLPVPQMWVIKALCGHENCGEPHTIYTAREEDWSQVVRSILEPTPIVVPCGNHALVWREDLMHRTEIAYDSPLR
jgi:hypothetical protein